MKSAAELRDAWNKNEVRRSNWESALETPEWEAVSALVVAEAIRSARSVSRSEADPALARNLMRLDGVLWAIEALQAAKDQPGPPPTVMEEYDDAYMKKLMEQKLRDQQ